MSISILFLIACSADSPVDTTPAPPSAPFWKDLRAVPVTSGLSDMWGSGTEDIFAVGMSGGVLHFDGEAWERTNLGVTAFLTRVWGAAPNDVYACGYRPFHFDGSTWSELNLGTVGRIYALHGSSARDVYFAGENGTVVHYDGFGYETIDTGISSHIRDVWSNGPDDVYLVSDDIVHFNGSTWETVDTGDPEMNRRVRCVAAASPRNVLVSGYRTAFFNGNDWITMPHAGYEFRRLWCNGPNDYYAASGRRVMRFNGRSWSVFFEMPQGYRSRFESVWGAPEVAMYAVGNYGEIWRYRNRRLELLNGTTDDIESLWASSENDIHVATKDEGLFRFDGKRWEIQNVATAARLNPKRIFGTEEDDVFAVDGGSLFHFDGDNWSEVPLERRIYPSDVWQAGDGTLFVTGFQVIAIAGRLSWKFDEVGFDLDKVWGRNSRDVYAAAFEALLHYDGDDWTVVPHEMSRIHDLWGCDGTIFAATQTGLWSSRWEQWTRVPGSPEENVISLWGASGSDIHLLVGRDQIYHYNGETCELEYTAPSGRLLTIWGTSAASIYAGGENGQFLHYSP